MFRTFWLGSTGGNTPPKCISFKWLFNEPADLCGSCSQRKLMLLRRLPDSSINRPITARGFLLYGTLEEHHHAGNHSKASQLPSCTANKEQTGNATEGNTSDSWIGIISGWSQLDTSRDLSWKKKPLKMLQSFMHTWNIKDYCTLFLQVFFLSKISEERYMVLEKDSFNLHEKNKRRRKKITTNTKKFSQVLNCNYKKLFPSACQLDNLSLLFGKFCAWFCLGFFSNFLWCD